MNSQSVSTISEARFEYNINIKRVHEINFEFQ